MSSTHYPAVATAVVAAFVLSGAWYAVLGSRLAALSPADAQPRPAAWTAAVEAVRNLVLALVLAVLTDRSGVDDVAGALGLAALLWIGFPVVLLSGSVYHERVPWRLAAIHAGDWLLKLVVVTTVVAVWH